MTDKWDSSLSNKRRYSFIVLIVISIALSVVNFLCNLIPRVFLLPAPESGKKKKRNHGNEVASFAGVTSLTLIFLSTDT